MLRGRNWENDNGFSQTSRSIGADRLGINGSRKLASRWIASCSPHHRDDDDDESSRRFYSPPAATIEDLRYRPSCSSRAADGFIRGSLVGMAWGAVFHPLEELSATGWITQVAPESQGKLLYRMRSMGQAGLMFGCFLGTFSGVTCAFEHMSNSKSWVCVFMGGFAAGSLLAVRTGSRRAVLVTAGGTGILTAALHQMYG